MPTTVERAPGPERVVLSDLDGTLLDHATYDWEPARETLADLDRRGIPVVLASSKTRAEIELWRERLGNRAPFVCENGGALYVPIGATPAPVEGAEIVDCYERIVFGVPYERLRSALRDLATEAGVELFGFGDGPAARIAAATGLAGDDLAAALRREFDEPFETAGPLPPAAWDALERGARTRGLALTHGGRFAHLTGKNSKGRAARALLRAYRAGGARAHSLGVGDGRNDFELLRVAERAAIVARPDGTHDPELVAALPGAMRTIAPGPRGFAEAVRVFLATQD
jgi:mannosyl-3-phosphoglycerate phosphatase